MSVSTNGDQDAVQQSLTFYFDAGALVKRYMVEDGTAWVEELDNHAIAIAQFGLVEVAAAFAAKRRGRFIRPDKYERALADLIHDAQQRYQLAGVDATLVDSAIQLTRRQKLRGYDAVHLACALALNALLVDNGLPPLTFVCADNDLLIAATSEGLAVDNPNNHA